MAWWIVAFEKSADTPLFKIPLGEPDLSRMQGLFSIAPENPMYDVYPVVEGHREALEEMTGEALDLDRFDYFVEQTSDE